MILLLEYIFTHAFILFMYGFLGIWEYHCTYILPFSSSAKDEVVAESFTNPNTVPTEETPVQPAVSLDIVDDYEDSLLTEDQKTFFENFFADVSVSFKDEEEIMKVDEDELLSMNTWQSNTPAVDISYELSSKANAQIKDLKIGEQAWIVEVVGEEQDHIHVSDGTGRAWINAERFNVFTKGDILSVLVDRRTEFDIELSNAEILQRRSLDFSLAEDIHTDDSYTKTVSA